MGPDSLHGTTAAGSEHCMARAVLTPYHPERVLLPAFRLALTKVQLRHGVDKLPVKPNTDGFWMFTASH